jgi:hypothetical protein
MESTIVMMMMITRSFFCFLGFLCLLCSSVHGLLSPKGVNFEGIFTVKSHSLDSLSFFFFYIVTFVDEVFDIWSFWNF